jgi:hypothetical protein
MDWWTRLPTRRKWLLGGVALFAIAAVLWFGPWLLTLAPNHGLAADQELKAKNDVRTTLVQLLGGLAVAGGLMVTYSSYRQNQRDQEKRWAEQDRTYQLNLRDQEKRWADLERSYELNADAQVTDTYTKSVEQLGHAQAPVRLGALYSLVSLAQANPPRRQNVVDVLCAYLRMPYSPPTPREAATGSVAASAEEKRAGTQPKSCRYARRPNASWLIISSAPLASRASTPKRWSPLRRTPSGRA